MTTIRLNVNDEWKTIDIEPAETLVGVLRNQLNLTGTKESCGQGECGACTVLLEGEAVNACLVLAASADGLRVTTIEGLSKNNVLDPVQEAFIEEDASQCGYCTPGMIMSAKGLLMKTPAPDVEDIKTALAGNVCRCTGYKQIIHAVDKASKAMSEASKIVGEDG